MPARSTVPRRRSRARRRSPRCGARWRAAAATSRSMPRPAPSLRANVRRPARRASCARAAWAWSSSGGDALAGAGPGGRAALCRRDCPSMRSRRPRRSTGPGGGRRRRRCARAVPGAGRSHCRARASTGWPPGSDGLPAAGHRPGPAEPAAATDDARGAGAAVTADLRRDRGSPAPAIGPASASSCSSHGNRLFVGQRHDMAEPAWQMPQGGIDKGETPAEAGRREMLEEIGTDRAELLAESRCWRSYDLPPKAAAARWRGRHRRPDPEVAGLPLHRRGRRHPDRRRRSPSSAPGAGWPPRISPA